MHRIHMQFAAKLCSGIAREEVYTHPNITGRGLLIELQCIVIYSDAWLDFKVRNNKVQ